ncbi:outer membrane protein assembly factor BamC [Candidatus Thioglobus sp.]|jgi:outer membrane protein assembly factor BamC|uniref:outer membrane protein assembly factor BamC n=1 Tax=Candidatus Thioglobus sp. TaxID=2026721 RepID=UPI001E0419F5|nr:outer membrane protein assembly factor BamC [Candidatus Thioglobus sp.]MBT3277270.1 outer membrane protein assembly factor BamC [Candidatus Thioglobus sp.]MBT4181251.1 outer membrane protein assembly factor BamC [Candidatus Thioglobus sp.]MBT4422179.1 outer membrane protein assembly factor BamC [Candidatus Thioglobus sp.]MBT4746777.1 outer membrane protein assembly factor BamC [Candidatus Thioglobus sp.]MBT5164335.1 outer membrane protein assembly factor BamC [Candidatus Thioglobus sp.]
MIKISLTALLSLSLVGCFSFEEKTQEQAPSLGERDIKYYANKTVTSLEIPPDLTKPSAQNSFKLENYVSNIQEDTISFSKKDEAIKEATSILRVPSNVEVKRSGERRWLVVDKKTDDVWNLSKSFFKSHGFAIKKTNKKIGLMETDFLENHPEIPDRSLGVIRSMLKKAIAARYALPIVDKYRIRIEPNENGSKTSVYLSLNSMEEVLTKAGSDDENTIWQSRPKDQALETEMLYRLMTFLGSDHAVAREKIIKAKEEQVLSVAVDKGIGGYAKLTFSLGQYDTWDNMGWALDQLNIDIEDKDVKEGSFYINVARTEDQGIFSRMFGDDAIKKSFQIIVKQIDTGKTEVYFNDLSEENEQATIDFSYEFLGNIAKQF